MPLVIQDVVAPKPVTALCPLLKQLLLVLQVNHVSRDLLSHLAISYASSVA